MNGAKAAPSPSTPARIEGWARWLAGCSFGCIGMVLAYVLVRVGMRVFLPQPAPATLVWVEHSPLLTSLGVAAFLAGMALIAGFGWVATDPLNAGRWLVRLTLVALIAILMQGLLVP